MMVPGTIKGNYVRSQGGKIEKLRGAFYKREGRRPAGVASIVQSVRGDNTLGITRLEVILTPSTSLYYLSNLLVL